MKYVLTTTASFFISSLANGMFFSWLAPKFGIEATGEQCFLVACVLWLFSRMIESAVEKGVKAAKENQ